MPYALADLLADEGESAKFEDVDQDGALTLLDLYLVVNLEIHARFESMERLQTEHARLEDNGDGRGSEVQLPYMPVKELETEEEQANEQAEEPETAADAEQEDAKADVNKVVPNPISNETLDGFRSRYILLKAPPEQTPDQQAPKEETPAEQVTRE
jgi:hypothetical protein